MSTTSLCRAAFTAGITAAVLLLVGCAGQRPATGDSTATATTGFGSAQAGAGTGTPAVGVTPPVEPPPPPPGPPPVAYPATARAYAETTVAAWSTGDLEGLAALTTPEVYEQFVEIPGKLRTDWIHHRCDGVAGSNYCALRNGDGDQITVRVVSQYLGGPHAARELSADLTTYPINGESYARAFVRAWAAGNTPRMRALARPDVVVAVNNKHQKRPTGTWALGVSGHHGGAGLLIVDVDINEGSIQFTLHVGTTKLGTRQAVVGYES